MDSQSGENSGSSAFPFWRLPSRIRRKIIHFALLEPEALIRVVSDDTFSLTRYLQLYLHAGNLEGPERARLVNTLRSRIKAVIPPPTLDEPPRTEMDVTTAPWTIFRGLVWDVWTTSTIDERRRRISREERLADIERSKRKARDSKLASAQEQLLEIAFKEPSPRRASVLGRFSVNEEDQNLAEVHARFLLEEGKREWDDYVERVKNDVKKRNEKRDKERWYWEHEHPFLRFPSDTKFPLFRLPVELQLRVISFALTDPEAVIPMCGSSGNSKLYQALRNERTEENPRAGSNGGDAKDKCNNDARSNDRAAIIAHLERLEPSIPLPFPEAWDSRKTSDWCRFRQMVWDEWALVGTLQSPLLGPGIMGTRIEDILADRNIFLCRGWDHSVTMLEKREVHLKKDAKLRMLSSIVIWWLSRQDIAELKKSEVWIREIDTFIRVTKECQVLSDEVTKWRFEYRRATVRDIGRLDFFR